MHSNAPASLISMGESRNQIIPSALHYRQKRNGKGKHFLEFSHHHHDVPPHWLLVLPHWLSGCSVPAEEEIRAAARAAAKAAAASLTTYFADDPPPAKPASAGMHPVAHCTLNLPSQSKGRGAYALQGTGIHAVCVHRPPLLARTPLCATSSLPAHDSGRL